MPTFRHGKNTVVLIDGNDFSTYFNEVTAALSVETAETTTFGSNGAKSYVVGLKDATATLSGFFEGSATGTDQALAAAIGTGTPLITIGVEGGTVGLDTLSLVGIETSYEVSSPVADVVSVSAEMQAEQDAIDYGKFVAVAATASSTGNGTALDNAASSANGAVFYLHVIANTRDGAITFKVAHSADNSTFVDLATFSATPLATQEAQRVEVTGTVNRYVRVAYTVAGSTGAATYTLASARR